MRLSDMNSLSSSQLNEKMQKQVGWNFKNLEKLSMSQASFMLESINEKLYAVKSKNLHESEQRADFNSLMLSKKILETYIAEKTESQNSAKSSLFEKAKSEAQQKAAGIALKHKKAGTKPKKGSASAEMMSMSTKELEKYAGTKHKGIPDKVNENSKRNKITTDSQHVFEDEVGQAESIMAAQDMVDKVQSMLEDVGEMLNEQLPPLVDNLRKSNSADRAAEFQSTASDALNSLMESVRSTRETMSNAVAGLSGEQTEPMSTPDADFDVDADDVDLDVDSGDDFDTSEPALGGDEPLGRSKRED